jgi:hypothetical protein
MWLLCSTDCSGGNSRTKGFRRRPRQSPCSMCFVCGKGSFINRNEAQATAVDLEAHLHQAKAELQSAQENSIITKQKISSALHERTNELEKAVEDLEQKNVELSRCSVDILLQYQQGNVVRSF